MKMYWIIHNKLAVVTILIDKEDVAKLADNGIRAFVSLYNISDLPSTWSSLEELFKTLEKYGIEIVSQPTLSGKTPPPMKAVELVMWIERKISEGKPVAIGCRRGWGRGGALAAAYLVYKGFEPYEACKHIEQLAEHYEEKALESYEQHKLPFAVKQLLATNKLINTD